MGKRICITLFLTSLIIAPLISQEEQNPKPKAEVYLITEFYHKLVDTALNLKEEYVDVDSFITIIHINDSACLIGIDHGSVENVEFFGGAKRIENPFFIATREDAEFYLWNSISYDSPIEKGALVFKEYVTGSLEERGIKYFFFSILFSPESEFQIYGKLLDY